MVKKWQPGTDYVRGDIVKYHGQKFKAIQGHGSLENWAPGVTPALWGKLEDDDDDSGDEHAHEHHGRDPEHVQVPEFHRPQYQNDSDEAPYQPQYQNDQGSVQQGNQPEKPGWVSEHKKQLEVGGAVLGALGVAGTMYGLKKHHDTSNEGGDQNTLQQNPPPPQYQNEERLPNQPEQKPSWVSEHKKQLEVGGAVLGALGVAGTMYGLKKHHDKSNEEADQNATQHQNPPQQQNYQSSVQQGKPPNQPEQKSGWVSEHKKELEVGGAVLGALGLAGAMYGLKIHHDESEEEKKTHNWARDNWEKDAQIRTEQYQNGMRQGPATWILTHGKTIPQDAIVVGQEHDWTLYICRAYHEGGQQIGKASQAFQKGAVIGYLHQEIQIDTFEVLVGDMRGLRWQAFSGRLNVQALGYKPVEGGIENDGTPLYIVKAPYNGFTHPGKTSEKLEGAYVPYGGTEKCINEYSVLCYNQPLT